MKQVFEEVLKAEGIRGALLFDTQGVVVHRNYTGNNFKDPTTAPWWSSFVDDLKDIPGLEMVYAGGRIYIRRIHELYLMILMDDLAPVAMIRLNCDVLLHGQKKNSAKRRAKSFFKRRG